MNLSKGMSGCNMPETRTLATACLVLSFTFVISTIYFANDAYAQFSGGEDRREGGGGRGLYFGGMSVPSIILYSVLGSIVVAVVYTVGVIARNETKKSSKASLGTNRHRRADGFPSKE